MEEEIFVLRSYIRRMLENTASTDGSDKDIQFIRTLCLAFATLARLTREQRALTQEPIDPPVETYRPNWPPREIISPPPAEKGEYRTIMERAEEIRKALRQVPPVYDDPSAPLDFSPVDTNPHPTFHPEELPPDADTPSTGESSQVAPPPRSIPASTPAPAGSHTPSFLNPPHLPAPLAAGQPAGLPSTPGAATAGFAHPPAPRPLRTKDPFAHLISPLAGSSDLIQAEIQSSISFDGPPLRRRRSHPPEPWTYDRQSLF